MGNSCVQNTIIEKNNLDDKYVSNKKTVHIWPELQYQNVHYVSSILSKKGYRVLIVNNIDTNRFQYNRVLLSIQNGLVQNIPMNG